MHGDDARVERVVSELKSRVDKRITQMPYREAQRGAKRVDNDMIARHVELRVGCGWCTASAGYPCVTSSGVVMRGVFHRSRTEASKGYLDAQRSYAARH